MILKHFVSGKFSFHSEFGIKVIGGISNNEAEVIIKNLTAFGGLSFISGSENLLELIFRIPEKEYYAYVRFLPYISDEQYRPTGLLFHAIVLNDKELSDLNYCPWLLKPYFIKSFDKMGIIAYDNEVWFAPPTEQNPDRQGSTLIKNLTAISNNKGTTPPEPDNFKRISGKKLLVQSANDIYGDLEKLTPVQRLFLFNQGILISKSLNIDIDAIEQKARSVNSIFPAIVFPDYNFTLAPPLKSYPYFKDLVRVEFDEIANIKPEYKKQEELKIAGVVEESDKKNVVSKTEIHHAHNVTELETNSVGEPTPEVLGGKSRVSIPLSKVILLMAIMLLAGLGIGFAAKSLLVPPNEDLKKAANTESKDAIQLPAVDLSPQQPKISRDSAENVAKIKNLTSEGNDLRKYLQEKNKEIGNLSTSKSANERKYIEEKAELNNKIASTNNDLNEVRQSLTDLRGDNTSLQKQLTTLKEQNASIKTERDNIKGELSQARSDATSWKAKFQELDEAQKKASKQEKSDKRKETSDPSKSNDKTI